MGIMIQQVVYLNEKGDKIVVDFRWCRATSWVQTPKGLIGKRRREWVHPPERKSPKVVRQRGVKGCLNFKEMICPVRERKSESQRVKRRDSVSF
jgi:hypothetical protein